MLAGCALVTAAALTPLTLPGVDWGMDGNLTPGTWEPLYWFRGALLCPFGLVIYAWPLALLVPTIVAIGD